jgi:glyoxylase-like metal-dependent hydrolase (beta-lactamase superfamily II)
MHIIKPLVTVFFEQVTNTVTSVVCDPHTHKVAIIDSVLNFDYASGRTSTESADEMIEFIKKHDYEVEWILETHAHADHLSAAVYLQRALGGLIAVGEHICDVQDVFGRLFNENERFLRDGSQFDRLFKDGETFYIGEMGVEVIHTPGHTPACISYLVGDALFVGDTLFMPDFGTARCDFPGGSAEILYNSTQKILNLPPETRMFVGHDYKAQGRDEYAWETTVGEQKTNNLHVGEGQEKSSFIKIRTERDATLSMPRLIVPAIQVNIRAGHMPEPDENGKVFLKVPINVL